MSYLEQLKKEAAAVKAREEALKQKEEKFEEIFASKVEPALKKLRLYLHEMSEQLNTLNLDRPVSFALAGIGEIKNLRQAEYLTSSYREKDHQFFLRITNKTERKVRFEVPDEKRVKRIHDYLWEHNIPFKWDQVTNSRHQFIKAVFVLDGEIYSEFQFTGVPEKAWVDMQVKNFPKLGKQNYLLRQNDLTEQFMDDLARFINHDHPDMNGFLRNYEAGAVWSQKAIMEKTPEQKMREEILAQMRAEKLQAEQADATAAATSPAAAKTPLKAQTDPISRPVEKPKKKGFLGGLFGKK